MNIIRGKHEQAETDRADGADGGTPGRRSVLGGLAARAASAWPHLRAADGTTVDASVIPDRGAATRVAIVSGFTEGWYDLAHTSGRGDRVTWDARKLPFLFVHGEFGGTDQEPYRDRFYTLGLQPMSRNPYLRSTSIL